MSDTLADPRIVAGMRTQMDLLRQRLDAGGRLIGWKVGFGAPAALTKLKLAAPLVGFLLDKAELQTGSAVSLAGWTKPAAEAEIAVTIGRDLKAGASDDEVRAAIIALGPAIELADVTDSGDDVEAILSGNIYQRHVILGTKGAAYAGARLDGLSGHLSRSGRDVPVPSDLESNTGRLIDIVRQVADVAAAAVGFGLRAGEFIICGSLTPPMVLQPDEQDIEFMLDPVGGVSVRFSAEAAFNPTAERDPFAPLTRHRP